MDKHRTVAPSGTGQSADEGETAVLKTLTSISVLGIAIGAMMASAASAQEVTSLEDALQSADPDRIAQMQNEIEGTTLSDIGAGINIQTVISDGVGAGQFTDSEAADLEEALALVNANTEYFNFDIAAYILEAIEEEADITPELIADVMRAFERLSPEGKRIVGDDPDFNPDNDLNLSEADQAIIDSVILSG